MIARLSHDVAYAIDEYCTYICRIRNVAKHPIEIIRNIMQKLAIKSVVHSEAHGMDGVNEIQFLFQIVQGSNFSVFGTKVGHAICEKED